MIDLEIQRKKIQNKLETLSILEKCEFERRLKTILNSKISKNKLLMQHRTIQEAYQNELKNRSKNEIKFILIVVATMLIGYFFDMPANSTYVAVLAIALTIAVYEIKKEIFDSKYLILYRGFEFEIDKLTNDISQYGYFLTSDSDLFWEYDGDNEAFKRKNTEKKAQARVELEIEVLRFMNLEVEVDDGN